MQLESGVIKLKNDREYPFNDSESTVALKREYDNAEYTVFTEVINPAFGVGCIRVYDKAVNGFKIAFSGSAKNAEVRYLILGEPK